MAPSRSKLKSWISRTPGLGQAVKWLYFSSLRLARPFKGSRDYWEGRYAKGATSGDGSFSNLALFKAEILNTFVREHDVTSIIEFGCGDGNQLLLAEYPEYLGVDVSETAVDLCKQKFGQDDSMSFTILSEYDGVKKDLSLSLDVIYHLVEDAVFEQHMRQLFASSERFVIIYSSDTNTQAPIQGEHIRHRKFSDWVTSNLSDWKLVLHVPNRFPYTGDDSTTSFSDFFVYRREADV